MTRSILLALSALGFEQGIANLMANGQTRQA
jgi:hypothetical protein